MITETEYTDYLGVEAPTDFKVLIDIAIGMLLERCPQFPKNSNEMDKFGNDTQDTLKKTLILQINHLDNNRELLEGSSGGSFSIGKYSESSEVEVYPIAITSLLAIAGICNLWIQPANGCRRCNV